MKEIVYNNFQRWVPESDIDGIDIKPEILSRIRNVIAQNGFIKNAVDLVPKVFPENVQDVLDLGYTLIGYTNFTHSSQGFHEVYILFIETTHRLCVYIDNTALAIGEDFSIVCADTPHHINFNLVNDQLKINLNIKATILDKEVMLNLSLVWLDEIAYIPRTNENQIQFDGSGLNDLGVEGNETSGIPHTYTVKIVSTGTPDAFEWKMDNGAWSMFPFDCSTTPIHLANGIYVKFNATTGHTLNDLWSITSNVGEGVVRYPGWYLTPRWLAWQLTDAVSFINDNPVDREIIEDFSDSTLINGLNLGDTVFNRYSPWLRGAISGHPNSMYMTNGSEGAYCVATLSNIANLKKMSFVLSYEGSNYENRAYFKVAVESFENVVFTLEGLDLDYTNYRLVEIQTDVLKALGAVNIWFIGYIPDGGTGYIIIDDLKLYASESLIIGKYLEGQRGMISSGIDGQRFVLSIYGNTTPNHRQIEILLARENIDWRMISIELYIKNSNNLYVMVGSIAVEDSSWVVEGDNLRGVLSIIGEDEAVQTLNFNYGVGESVRVDTQHLIFSEVAFNNRIYAVNGSYQILQSHIAGNGRIQPDSFPYSNEDNYGFIEESKSSSIQTLFVINNNFLLLFMLDGFSLYTIAINRGTFQKDLRLLASSFTGFNPLSLTRTITGISPTIGAYWVTREGTWFHDGSMGGVPMNLITETHKNFWREEVDITLFGFYDYEDNEYWYAYHKETDREETSFLVYEINYKTFRYVRIAKAYTGFAGYYLGKVLLFAGDAIETLDKSGTLGLQGYTEMHFNDLGNKYSNKIGQELFVTLKEAYSGGSVFIKANFDNRWSVSYTISTDEKQMVRLLPISARFRTVQLSVLFGKINSTPMLISDFGMKYTEDGQGRLGECLEHRVEVEGFGYGKAYGRYYGGSSPVGETGYGTSYGKNYGN